MLKVSRRLLTVLATALVVGGLASAAQADVLHVNGERTAITPSAQAIQFLSAYNVAVTPTGPASTANGSLIFPITRGEVTTAPKDGKVFHTGGVRFAVRDHSFWFRDFVLVRKHDRAYFLARLNDRKGWVLYAWVDDFAVVPGSGNEATVTGRLFLSGEAAQAFNRLVGSNVVAPGTDAGTFTSILRFG